MRSTQVSLTGLYVHRLPIDKTSWPLKHQHNPPNPTKSAPKLFPTHFKEVNSIVDELYLSYKQNRKQLLYSLKPFQRWASQCGDERHNRQGLLIFSFNTWGNCGSKSKEKMLKNTLVISGRTRTQKTQFFSFPKLRLLPNTPWLRWRHTRCILLLSPLKSTQLPIGTRLRNRSNSITQVGILVDTILDNYLGWWFGGFVRACFFPSRSNHTFDQTNYFNQ